jgi:hypothetical protein
MTRRMFIYFDEAINLIRDIMKDSPLSYKINENFEKELYTLLRIIPEKYEDNIIMIFTNLKILLGSIDYNKLKNNCNDLKLKFKTNSSTLIKSFINPSRKIKRFIDEMIIKCEPIFDCLDEILRDPIPYINIICDLQTPINDIFG